MASVVVRNWMFAPSVHNPQKRHLDRTVTAAVVTECLMGSVFCGAGRS